MHLRETLQQALFALGANKLRSWLTLMGVAVGVFSIISVMTAIDAIDASVESGLSSLGANTFQIQKMPATVFGRGHRRNQFINRPDISWQEAQAFSRNMAGKARTIGMVLQSPANQASFANRTTNPDVLLTGGDEHFPAANGFRVERGRALTPTDITHARNSAVLGAELAEHLFGSLDPLGRSFKVGGQVYRAVGLFERKGPAFGQSQDNFLLIPATRFLDHVDDEGSIAITVEAYSRQEYQRTLDQAVGAMRLARGLTAREANNFEIQTNESLIDSFRQIKQAIATGAFIISFMALLTAGVGIMNIMLVSVTERTREIGIRKSVGAPKASILRQFLIEALLLSLAGGLIGIAVGMAAGNIVALNFNLPPIIPLFWMVVAVGVCSAIGTGFGLFPAWKAANLDPVEALRPK